MSRVAPIIVATLLAFGVSAATAGDRRNDRPPREGRSNHGAYPGRDDRIARDAQRQTGGGRVLSVQPGEGGHRVKILKDGEVHVLTVPERDQPRR